MLSSSITDMRENEKREVIRTFIGPITPFIRLFSFFPFSFFFTSFFLCLAPSFSLLYPSSPLSTLLLHSCSLPPFSSLRSDSALFQVCLNHVFLTQAITLSLSTEAISHLTHCLPLCFFFLFFLIQIWVLALIKPTAQDLINECPLQSSPCQMSSHNSIKAHHCR